MNKLKNGTPEEYIMLGKKIYLYYGKNLPSWREIHGIFSKDIIKLFDDKIWWELFWDNIIAGSPNMKFTEAFLNYLETEIEIN